MSESTGAVRHYLEQYETLSAALPGRDLDWLSATREGALGRFHDLGFPGPREEAWKYTRTAPIERRAFRAGALTPALPASADLEPHLLVGAECARLVFVDGHYAPALSSAGASESGVGVTTFADALYASPELVRAHLARYAGADAHAFTALNTAFMAEGAVVHVGERAEIERVVHLLFVATGAAEETVSHPRILVIAEPGSRVAVVESYQSLAETCYFTNALTEIAAMERARVTHYKVQGESTKAYHVATLQVHQQAASEFVSHSISLGGRLVRNDINVVLDGERAHCTLRGLILADGRQHVDYHTVIEHVKPYGTSAETYKGVLGGHGRGVFDGKIKVHQDAQKTDAHQSSKNLLLSKNAEIDTKPQLEIYADDVKCSHGATVGQLDEDMIFYLRSRGIDADTARALLVFGFARDIVDAVDVAPLKQKLTEFLITRMPDADNLREMIA